MNITQLVFVIPAFFILDIVGRKPVLLFGSIGMTASHFIVAAMIAQYSYDWDTNSAQAWVGVAFIIAYMAFFGIGWGPVPWSMREFRLILPTWRMWILQLTVCSR